MNFQKTKKITFLFTILSILFAFYACDPSTPADETGDNSGDSGTETPTVDPWITSMESGDYNTALTALEKVIDEGSTEPEVLLYASALQVAELSSDVSVKGIASAAGFTAYPDSLNDIVKTGLPMKSYTFNSFDHEGNLIPYTQLLPEVTPKEGNPYTEINSAALYLNAVLYNLILSYENGLNVPISQMVAAMDSLSAKLISNLGPLSAQDQIVMTKAMLSHGENAADDYWPKDADGNPLEIKIGKAEILASLSVIEMMAAVVNAAGSVDYSFPLKELYIGLSAFSGDVNAIAWKDMPTDPLGTLLHSSSESASYLTKSGNYFSSALGHIEESATLFGARTAESDFNFSPKYLGETWTTQEIPDNCIVLAKLASKIRASVDDGTTVYIPSELFGLNYASYKEDSAWPKQADWSMTVDEVTGIMNPPPAPAFNFKALFDKPLLALDSLFAVDPATGEPLVYKNVDGTWGETPVTEFTADDYNNAPSADYAFKFNNYSLGGVLQGLTEADINALFGMFGDMPFDLIISGNSIYISPQFKDLYYGMFNEPGVAPNFTSTIDPNNSKEMPVTGSFWYQLFCTVTQMSQASPQPQV